MVRFWAEKPNISESDEDNDVLGGDVAGGRNNDESIIVLTDDSENDQNGKEDTPAKLNQAFRRATKRKYTLDEKDRLGKLVVEKKKAFDKLERPGAQDGYIAKAVREFYPDLRDMKSGSLVFDRAVKLAKRCYANEMMNGKDPTRKETSTKKVRRTGGGRKLRVESVRNSVFEWFVDVRTSLKSRLPKKLFMLKCEEIYRIWLAQQSKTIQAEHREKPLMFRCVYIVPFIYFN